MNKKHYSNQGIRISGKLSINLVSEAILDKADYVGRASGANTDKSNVFAYHIGANGSPVIDKAPVSMECKVEDVYETDGVESFVCSVVNTYASEDVLDGNGKLDYTKLKPVLFDFPTYSYLATGEVSLRTEPGMLTMYAMSEKDNPCIVTILETYASQEAYKKHIASSHFQKYKQGTLHMVKSLVLSDQNSLNPANEIKNYIK